MAENPDFIKILCSMQGRESPGLPALTNRQSLFLHDPFPGMHQTRRFFV